MRAYQEMRRGSGTTSREGICLYRAEKLKYRHSLSGKLLLLLPMIDAAAAYGLSGSNGDQSFYNWWYAFLLPGLLTVVSCQIGEKDRKLKNRAALLMARDSRKVWDAKILTGMRMLLLSHVIHILAGLGAGIVLYQVQGIGQSLGLTPGDRVLAFALMTLTMAWQLPFCLWLECRFGILCALGVNLALNLAGVVAAVEFFWFLCPYSILPRMMCSVLGILPNGLPAREGSVTFSPELLDGSNVLYGLILALLWCLLLWAVTRSWYGRKGAQTV